MPCFVPETQKGQARIVRSNQVAKNGVLETARTPRARSEREWVGQPGLASDGNFCLQHAILRDRSVILLGKAVALECERIARAGRLHLIFRVSNLCAQHMRPRDETGAFSHVYRARQAVPDFSGLAARGGKARASEGSRLALAEENVWSEAASVLPSRLAWRTRSATSLQTDWQGQDDFAEFRFDGVGSALLAVTAQADAMAQVGLAWLRLGMAERMAKE